MTSNPTDLIERTWREGWKTCRDSLTEDEAYSLTEDVEEDAWLCSEARQAANTLTQQDAAFRVLKSECARALDYHSTKAFAENLEIIIDAALSTTTGVINKDNHND